MYRKPNTLSVTVRRAVAVGALVLPLSLGAAGLANAGEHERSHDCDGHSAAQDGGLADLGIESSPALNLGGILSGGPVAQHNSRSDASNSGILQSGCGDHEASQAGDLVEGTLEADPQLNLGGILSGGPVQQGSSDHDSSNSGIVQD
ncbi:hypothetical protein [Pseudonocardia sp. MH-G8]|uniref:hypothetical protein n=1 Tax=Pseudonocardia sp. MH-G8 TaxID=1854588 RepID=UPI000B9FCA4B|nr:hypothetical protein [Pseudonocardia sp. MH-G8]OZM77639.1 hypothetical protein CFP66_34890 [Pseudonocardia sp. MH-G8]